MTTPPQPPRRPGDRGEPVRPDPATQRLPRPEPPTQRLPRPEPSTQRLPRPDGPTEQLRAQRPTDAATQRIQRPPQPAGSPPSSGPPPRVAQDPHRPEGPKPRRFRPLDRLSISLIAIIVLALVAGVLAGAELYARHRADGILVAVTECVVDDGATASIGVNPPFLWQYLTGDYSNISVSTAGNQVQSAKGMQADVSVADVRLQDSANSKGTIGSLNATLSWTAAGIKDTVAANLPVVGSLVTGVTTNAADGTLELQAGSFTVTAKPVVANGDLSLQVVDLTGPFDKATVQTALDVLTKKLNEQYPLGIHADSVEVTDAGVIGKFSTQNASIPKEDANACFAQL